MNPARGGGGMIPSRQAWGVLAAAFVLAVSLFWPAYTPLDGYDWIRMHSLYKEHYRAALLDGRLPLWNPYSGLGRPFLADMETAALYPPNLLFLCGLAPGLLLSLWLHLAVALAGTWRCARGLGCGSGPAWLAALGFTCGAPLLGHLQAGQFQLFATVCWLPLVIDLGCALQDEPGVRRLVHFALAFALMFLAGHPPLFWVCGWGVVAFLAVRRSSRRGLAWVAAGGALAMGLIAAQLLPFLELVRQGNRPVHDPAFATSFGQAASWWSLFRSKPGSAYFYNWEFNLYMGLPVGLLALAGLAWWRRIAMRPVLATSLAFGILAAGAGTPVLPWLAENVPGWGAGRFPSRYGVVVALGIALLAAAGLEAIASWLRARGQRSRQWTLGCVIALPLLTAAESYRAFVERSAAYAGPAIPLREAEFENRLREAGLLHPGQPPPRIIAHFGIVRENSGLSRGYSTFTSYSSPMLGRVWDYLHAMSGTSPAALEPIKLPAAVYETEPTFFRGVAAAAWWDIGRQEFTPAAQPEPRVVVCFAARTVPDHRAALQQLALGHRWQETALLEEETAAQPPSSGPPARVTIDAFHPEEIVLRVSSPRAGWLVLAEAWYPGWRAIIDGEPARVQPANGWMRAVALPAGTREVVLSYRPASFWCGSLVTVGSAGAALALWWRGRKSMTVG